MIGAIAARVKSCYLLARSCYLYEAIASKSWTMWNKGFKPGCQMDAWKELSIFDTAAAFLWSRTFLIDAWHMVSDKASQVSFHSQAKTITSPLKHPTLILHPTRQSDVIAHLGCLVGRFSEKLLGRHRFGNGPRHHKHRENPQNSHPESAAVAFILKHIVWKLLKMSYLHCST